MIVISACQPQGGENGNCNALFKQTLLFLSIALRYPPDSYRDKLGMTEFIKRAVHNESYDSRPFRENGKRNEVEKQLVKVGYSINTPSRSRFGQVTIDVIT